MAEVKRVKQGNKREWAVQIETIFLDDLVVEGSATKTIERLTELRTRHGNDVRLVKQSEKHFVVYRPPTSEELRAHKQAERARLAELKDARKAAIDSEFAALDADLDATE